MLKNHLRSTTSSWENGYQIKECFNEWGAVLHMKEMTALDFRTTFNFPFLYKFYNFMLKEVNQDL